MLVHEDGSIGTYSEVSSMPEGDKSGLSEKYIVANREQCVDEHGDHEVETEF